MIFHKDYFGKFVDHPDATEEAKRNADDLLEKVNSLLDYAFEFDIDFIENPMTGTLVSGAKFGGFRPQDCPIGASTSAHKEGKAVDIYDPNNSLDNWINDTILAKFELYREAPIATRGWVHLSTKAPKSGKRTFMP